MRKHGRSTWIRGSLFLLLVWIPSLSFAQAGVGIYSLEKSIQEAFSNNWSLKAKMERIDETGRVMEQAKADFFPKLSTSYGYTRLGEVNRSAPVPLGGGLSIPGKDLNTQDNYQWKSTVKQPVFTGFALISTYELAKLGMDQSAIDLDLERIDLALRVKEAYFNILKADRAVQVAQKAVESLESHLNVARSFYEVGIIPVNDLLKAEVQLADARQNLVKAQNGSKLARSTFNVVLARAVEAPVEVEDILVLRPERGGFQAQYDKALMNRPEIKALDTRLLQLDQQIRLARSKYYPEVALSYDYIKEGDQPDVSGSSFHDDSRWQAMAVASWTFWEWGKTDAAVREKESVKRQVHQLKSGLGESIALEIRKALLELEQAEKNIPTTEKAVEQAEENLRVSQERYKAQVTTSTEVLDAQTLLTQARTNYFNALYDHNLAKARLQRAMGEQ